MHQTSPSLYWTLKFFNSLIVSLGFLFFYYFAKEFTKNEEKALWAVFFLACIPCYLSHFIWAHALTVTLFFPAFYCFMKARNDRLFVLPAAIVISGIFLTQPTQSMKFAVLLFSLFLMTSVFTRRFNTRQVLIVVLAVVISSIWWGPVGQDMKRGTSRIALREGAQMTGYSQKTSNIARGLFNPRGGTATREYTLSDFLFPPRINLINNPTGVGLVISFLVLFRLLLLFRRNPNEEPELKIYQWTTLCWLIFTFLGINSATFRLPVGLFAFRFWMLFAIPASLLAADSIAELSKFFKQPIARRTMAMTFVIAALWTSGHAKWRANTTYWSPGIGWVSDDEIKGYLWLRKYLLPETKVFAFIDNLYVIGFDMRADFWSNEYKHAFQNAFDLNLPDLHGRLKKQGYQYLIIGAREIRTFGVEAINKKLKSLYESPLFSLRHCVKNGGWIFKIL